MYRAIVRYVIILKLCLVAIQASASTDHLKQPTLVFESVHNYAKTIEHVRRAIKGMNFVLIKEHNLDDGFALKSDNTRQRIIYFCNFDQVNKAINYDYRVGQFLPCRITVMEVKGKVYVSAINPKRISDLMYNNKLDQICEEIYEMYIALLSEVTF